MLASFPGYRADRTGAHAQAPRRPSRRHGPRWPAAASAMSSTNSGSTRAVQLVSARASVRPSAADDRCLTGGVNLGQQGPRSARPMTLTKSSKAVAGTGVAVRLEGQHQTAPRECAPGCGQRGRHLDRMVAVVVNHGEPAALLLPQPPRNAGSAGPHALEAGQCARSMASSGTFNSTATAITESALRTLCSPGRLSTTDPYRAT